jgi:hypothetical protein
MTRWIARYGGVAIILAMVAYIGMQIVDPAPIAFYSRTVVPQIVSGGQSIIITSNVQRTKKCSSTVHRSFIDSSGRVASFDPLEVGPVDVGTEQFRAEVVVPQGMAPGPLTYRVRVDFHCNWFQDLFGGVPFVLPDIVIEYVG